VRLPAPFEPVGDHIGIALPGGRALFTTRRGGVSEGAYASLNLGRWTDDDADAVDRNRRILAEIVGVPLEAVVQGRQVHDSRVERRADGDGRLSEADGQATDAEGLALLVLTADCLPVALIAPGAVAMLHAGWRGLAAGILEEGVGAVRELAGDAEIRAAIGPGAGGCCYEVGPEVHGAFGRETAAAERIDLKAIAAERLRAAGVAEVHDAGLCAICEEHGRFFSHRRDGGVTGRQAGVVWRTAAASSAGRRQAAGRMGDAAASGDAGAAWRS
jgi:purine-nucleoside/S-methyl-5'-thioadenosine phosphorylase / adenosine deaminase